MGSRGFWQELKRRHVYRVAAAYVVVGWVLIQVVTQVFPIFHLPDWIDQAIVLLILIGFPIALVLAWAFDAVPRGNVTAYGPADSDGPSLPLRRRSRRAGLIVGAIGVLVAVIAGGAYWHFGRDGSRAVPTTVAATGRAARGPDGAQRNQGSGNADSTAYSVASGLHDASAANAAPIAPQPIPSKSIAVLPFENLSTDKGNAYFADGIQDLILTKLADIGGLKVVSRTATENDSSHPDDLSTIGHRLGVATFLEGTVQKAGNQVLINVQLIDAKTDNHIWARSYQRDVTNIFGVEGEVAGKVADALNAKLTAAESAAVAHVPTTNPQAYDDYLRGLHYDHEAGKGDWTTFLPQAIAAYGKAVAGDPNFALAWAALSNARSDAYFWAGDHSKANLLAADTSARRALQLDPRLADAHIAMAGVERLLQHDLVAAHSQMQRAVELRPNDADALANLAISDANLGIAGNGKLLQRAIALDPTDPFNYYQAGVGLAAAGDYAGARQAERRALAIDPQFVLAYLALSRIEISDSQNVEAATKILEHMAPGTPVNVSVVIWRIKLLLFRRQYDAARALAGKFAGKFASGPGAVDMTFARANIEWLAGKVDPARGLYRTAIGLVTRPGSEISGADHARLGVAYARLGNADAAIKEGNEALTMAVKSHQHDAPQRVKYDLASARLALGHESAAVEALTEVLSMDPSDIRAPWLLFLARMQLAPTWDPIRNDPRFQALLKEYAATAASTSNAPTAAGARGTNG
jgi:TolB-like protein/Tfp pilus assembly protein PilF